MSIPELTQSLAADSGNWELRLSLVQALMEEGNHEAAVEVVNQGEAIPHEAAPWLAAAKTYLGGHGLYAVAVLSGLTDMDAITLSTSRLVGLEPERGEVVPVAPTPLGLAGDGPDGGGGHVGGCGASELDGEGQRGLRDQGVGVVRVGSGSSSTQRARVQSSDESRLR